MRDEGIMMACCNDGTRLVFLKIERIDYPKKRNKTKATEQSRFTTFVIPTSVLQRAGHKKKEPARLLFGVRVPSCLIGVLRHS